MSSVSGRFSKYPAVDRSVPRSKRLDEIEADDTSEVSVEAAPVAAPAVTPVATPGLVNDVIVVPDVNAPDLLKWVGSNEKRRVAALEAETAGRKRKGVLKELDPNYAASRNSVPLL